MKKHPTILPTIFLKALYLKILFQVCIDNSHVIAGWAISLILGKFGGNPDFLYPLTVFFIIILPVTQNRNIVYILTDLEI